MYFIVSLQTIRELFIGLQFNYINKTEWICGLYPPPFHTYFIHIIRPVEENWPILKQGFIFVIQHLNIHNLFFSAVNIQ